MQTMTVESLLVFLFLIAFWDEVVNNSEFVVSMASTETPRESAECNLHF